jgi:CHRD domain-containing protein
MPHGVNSLHRYGNSDGPAGVCAGVNKMFPQGGNPMRHSIRYGLGGIAITALLAFAAPAFAADVQFKADLKGTSEVPPNQSAATGTVTATYDTDSKKLSWTGTYSGLSGPATAAHFHGPAEAGKNAGVAVPITPNTSPLAGSATLTDAQAADLQGGRWYVNVHTAANPGGEIRGQLTK